MGFIDRWRTKQDEQIVKGFDKFVVLTHEDKEYWGELSYIEVILNAALSLGSLSLNNSSHRVVAVGHLDYQKGFDQLIKAWNMLYQQKQLADCSVKVNGN